ncbi:MAG: A/G-specific adenine glycosylase [Gemmatimonadota bacterium]
MASKSTPQITRDRHDPAAAFRTRLMRWFRRHGRDLPWRRTRDPYHIAVSEFMLQQTQVSRVQQYYQSFLDQYPTIHHLASAQPAAVRESWQGLGYYRRAANLHKLAQTVVRERGGLMPATVDELRALPGVGRYTAGAIASFAYERSEPAVDTNVERVIRRAFLGRRSRAKTDRVWKIAGSLVPRQGQSAWTFNQAIMELGALICTARVARCSLCPVRGSCMTGKKGGREAGSGKREAGSGKREAGSGKREAGSGSGER